MPYKYAVSKSNNYSRKRVTIKLDKDMNILNLEEIVDAICEGFRNFKKG